MHEDEVLFTEFFNQKLKERGLNLKQLSEATGIAVKHLENFGNGRFERLPSAPYVHGYFVKLGDILGFDPEEWWSRIKEEDTVHRSGPSDRMPPKRFSKMRGRALAVGGAIVGLMALYIALRFTTIIGEPGIIIVAPQAQAESLSTSVSNSVMVLKGRVTNGDSLTMNGNGVTLGRDGAFEATIVLQAGPNAIELRAKKFLGREKVVIRQVYYDDSQIIAPAPEDPGQF